MQLSRNTCQDRAMTLIEVLVVIGCVFFLLILTLPRSPQKNRASGVVCMSHLRQNALAALMWQQDQGGWIPQNVSYTNGGAAELISTGNIAAYFRTLSIYLGDARQNWWAAPKTLRCPGDRERVSAKSFLELNNTNISYFVSLNPDASQPQTILFGDDNFMIDGVSVKPGIMNPWTNQSLAWTTKRHKAAGNIAFGDGHVETFIQRSLINLIAQPESAVNLTVIP